MKFSVWKKMALAAFGLLFAALVAEVTLRVTSYGWKGVRIRDPKTGLLVFKPGSTFENSTPCFNVSSRMNRFGFHAHEWDEQKPDGVFRIAVMGDSFVEAVQVPYEKSFSALLENRLNDTAGNALRFEVLPFGKGGNGTYDNIQYALAYAARFQPDLIIDAFLIHNDVSDDLQNTEARAWFAGERNAVYAPPGSLVFFSREWFYETAKRIGRRSTLVMTLYANSAKLRSQQTQVLGIGANVEDLQVFRATYTGAWETAWNMEEKLLQEMQRTARNMGAKFALVSLTEGFRVHPELFAAMSPQYKNPMQYDFEKPERILGDIAARNNISYLPLLPAFRERLTRENSMTIWQCDGHWNETGHAWAADALYEFLIKNGLLK